MNEELVEKIREEFVEGLKKKTGWGRLEILNEFDQAVYRALLKIMDKKEEEKK